MQKPWLVWVLAVLITLASAVYQRRTGPTRPVRGEVILGGAAYSLELPRTHEGQTPQVVEFQNPGGQLQGTLAWRRFPTADPWQLLPLVPVRGRLQAELPGQPPAGKLEYQLRLARGGEEEVFPERPAVIRFKGTVSRWILAPHIIFIFLGMVFSNVAGLECLRPGGNPRRAAWWALGLIVWGGLIFGPLVQKAAFNAYWTGIPFGYDLTDNKTLIGVAAWILAAWGMRGGRQGRWWILAASLVTLVVFAIPHSVWGSELDWNNIPAGAGP